MPRFLLVVLLCACVPPVAEAPPAQQRATPLALTAVGPYWPDALSPFDVVLAEAGVVLLDGEGEGLSLQVHRVHRGGDGLDLDTPSDAEGGLDGGTQHWPELSQWWSLDDGAVEHGFDLRESPPGDGPLRIQLRVEGAWVTEATEADALVIRGDDGRRLRYSHPCAWDRDGEALPSWLDGGGERIEIVVDDAGALWPLTIDPILTMDGQWTDTQAGAQYGTTVAGLGDVNGDGFDDFAVGAPFRDGSLSTHTDRGLVHAYYGALGGPSTTYSWVKTGTLTGQELGGGLAGAGDVNGDGYSDILIGSPGYGNGQAGEGLVQIYAGGATGLAAAALWSREGAIVGLRTGEVLATGGDLDNDGDSEILIGEPDYDTSSSTDAGRVLVFAGAASGPSATPTRTWLGDQAGAHFGAAVLGAGDLSGDGFGDVVVGQPGYDGSASLDRGRVSLYLGSATGVASTASSTWIGASAGDALGSSLARAGDATADGWADFVAGAPGYNVSVLNDAGGVYLFDFLSASYPSAALWAEGSGTQAALGSTLAAAGDWNGDGFADVAAGAPGHAAFAGRLHVLYGDGVAGSAPEGTITGPQGAARLGASLAFVGDVDGDGLSDVLVGSPQYDGSSGVDVGQVSLVPGVRSGIGSRTVEISGAVSDGEAGTAIAWVGDLDGDGRDDLALGSPDYVNGQTSEGRVRVYSGTSSGLSSTAAWSWEGDVAGGRCGTSISGGVDLTGDGRPDLAVGCPLHTASAGATGRVVVLDGAAQSLHAQVLGTQPGAGFGQEVLVGPDGDANGVGELFVVAPSWDEGDTDVGHVVHHRGTPGGLALEQSQAWTGASPYAQMGLGLAAGDLSGDGLSDLVIGSPGYTNTLTERGRIAVLLGSVSGYPGVADQHLDGTSAGQNFGRSLAVIGDSNNDGRAELAVGRPGDSPSALTQAGAVAVHRGATTGILSIPAYTIAGTTAGGRFGTALAAAGDVNVDGIGDFVVGSPEADPALTDAGRVSVVLGGSTSGTIGRVVDGSAAGDLLGTAVTGGDWNGDGAWDVAAGQPGRANDGAGLWLLAGGGALDSLDTAARAFQTTTIAPTSLAANVARGSRLGANSVVVEHEVRPPSGPVRARLEVEWVPANQQFTGAGTDLGAFVTIPAMGSPLSLTTTENASSNLRGRARLHFAASGGWPQSRGPWRSFAGPRGARGLDVRTACSADFDADGACDADDPDDDDDGSPDSADCADTDPSRNPALAEIVADGIDQDCSGGDLCYADADHDGAGGPALVDSADLSCLTSRGEAAAAGDCDDNQDEVHPLAIEVCDGFDNDCSSGSGTPPAGDAEADDDGDLSLSCSPFVDSDALPLLSGEDCDDSDAAVHPGASEVVADAVDQDCDGVDRCWIDADADGFGSSLTADAPSLSCASSSGLAGQSGDCDDTHSTVHPGAVEFCDGFSNGCTNGTAIPALGSPESDDDGDGFVVCGPFVLLATTSASGRPLFGGLDCSDSDATRFPGAAEICDAVDQDCDASVVESFADTDNDLSPDCVDPDDDGDGDPDTSDCAPLQAAVAHGLPEVLADAVDQDCDGNDLCYADLDGDDFGGIGQVPGVGLLCLDQVGRAAVGGDCDDTHDFVHPGAPELCNGWDDGCLSGGPVPLVGSGEDDPDGDHYLACAGFVPSAPVGPSGAPLYGGDDCAPMDNAVHPMAPESCDALDSDCDGSLVDAFPDFDGDGSPDCVDPDDDGDLSLDVVDCAPFDVSVHPLATELRADGIDQNCDGGETCFEDADLDGFGGSDPIEDDDLDCTDEPGASALGTDCEDAAATVYPGAPEVCDGFGSACIGGSPAPSAVEVDGDGDQWVACGPWVGNVPMMGGWDCAPDDPTTFPLAAESCDLLDQDCDGDLLDGEPDPDLDTIPSCVDPDDDGDLSPDVLDCAPLDPAVSPLAEELCDGIDQDCDLDLVAAFSDFDGDTLPDCADADDDGDASLDADDCAPFDAAIFPDAAEVCDGVDQNCDGSTSDEGVDLDGDALADCVDPDDDGDGAADLDDCAPQAAQVFPGAAEDCDTTDSDCDGDFADGEPDLDGDTLPDCADADADGDGAPALLDCDDLDATVRPGAMELCDEVDSDCDGALDDGADDTDADGSPDCIDPDDDDDLSPDAADCAPLDATVHPGAEELCNLIDEDCDGDAVDAFSDFDGDALADCFDDDDDQDGAADGGDCAPFDASIHDGATESCDSIDSDCDGDLIDEFEDNDADGEVDCLDSDDDSDGVGDASDCAPQDPSVHPFAEESCDALDSDCDGDLLDGLPDADGDGRPDCGQASALSLPDSAEGCSCADTGGEAHVLTLLLVLLALALRRSSPLGAASTRAPEGGPITAAPARGAWTPHDPPPSKEWAFPSVRWERVRHVTHVRPPQCSALAARRFGKPCAPSVEPARLSG